jgi:magnesium-transporting ATPase (P-type)
MAARALFLERGRDLLEAPLLDEVDEGDGENHLRDGDPFPPRLQRVDSLISSTRSDEDKDEEDAIICHVLADLTRNQNTQLLQAMGGVEGVAAVITMEVNREIDGGAGGSIHATAVGSMSAQQLAAGRRVVNATGMPRSSENIRRRLFGHNDMVHNILPPCGFCRLLFGCVVDDPMVILFAGATVALALGLIQCVPVFIAVPQGDVHIRRCPSKPLWSMGAPIHLPPPAPVCRDSWAWSEGLGILLLGLGAATLKALGEWWRQKRLTEMLTWCRDIAKSTVIREGLSMHVPCAEVLVGDMVLLAAGDMVPADAVLAHSLSLKVEESNWLPDPFEEGDDDSPVRSKDACSRPFLLAGSMVVQGEGMALVTSVGKLSHWQCEAAGGSSGSTLVAKLVRDPVPLRRPLERLARLTTRWGYVAVGIMVLLRAFTFALHLSTYSCFDVTVEKCAQGAQGLNNATLCEQAGYVWQRHARALSAADAWVVTEGVVSTGALLLLLIPHGLTAVISAFTTASLADALSDKLLIQSIKALDVMGRVTSMCIDKNGLLTSGDKTLAMAHLCGVPFNGFDDDDDKHHPPPPPPQPSVQQTQTSHTPAALLPQDPALDGREVGPHRTEWEEEEEQRQYAVARSNMASAGSADTDMSTGTGTGTSTRVERLGREDDASGGAQRQARRQGQGVLNKQGRHKDDGDKASAQQPSRQGQGDEEERPNTQPRTQGQGGAIPRARGRCVVNSWLARHLHPTAAGMLCEGLVLTSRASNGCCSSPSTTTSHASYASHACSCSARGLLARTGLMCEDYSIHAGVRQALVALGCDWDEVYRAGRKQVVRKWPFAKTAQCSYVLLRNTSGTGGRFYAAGAAKSVLEKCTQLLLPDGSAVPLSVGQRLALDHVISTLSNISLNGVALAYRTVAQPDVLRCDEAPQGSVSADSDPVQGWVRSLHEHVQLLATDMVFVGLLAFKNHLPEHVPRDVSRCEALGVKVRIMTGEAMEGGKAVALACGLISDGAVAMTGEEWKSIPTEEQVALAPAVRVLAEATPLDKASLVGALRASGEVVAACVDSVEDEAVREAAHVVVSPLRQAQQAAMQDADLVCLDDKLVTLIHAVRRGRLLHTNVEAYVELRISSSVVVTVLCLLGAAGGTHILLPEQMLATKVLVDIVAIFALVPVECASRNERTCLPVEARCDALKAARIEPFFELGSGESSKPVTSRMAIRILTQTVVQCSMLVLLVLTGSQWMHDCTQQPQLAHSGPPQCFPILPNGQSMQGGWREMNQNYLYSVVFDAFMCCQIANLVGAQLGAVGSYQTWQACSVCELLLRSRRLIAQAVVLVAILILSTQMASIPTLSSPLRTVAIDAAGWQVCAVMAAVTLATSVATRLVLASTGVQRAEVIF